MEETSKTEETIENLLAQESKRIKNYTVQPVLAAVFTFLFSLSGGIVLFFSGLGWVSLIPPVLGAVLSVFFYFLLKNCLHFRILSLDMFGLILANESLSSVELKELKAHTDLILEAQKRIIRLLQRPEAEDALKDFYDEAMKKRMRERLNAAIEKLENEKKS